MKRGRLAATAVLGMALCFASVSDRLHAEDDALLLKQAQSLFKPLPQTMGTSEFPITPVRATLGQMLFFDPRLSGSNLLSCASCHNPSFAWGDAQPRATGQGMRVLGRP